VSAPLMKAFGGTCASVERKLRTWRSYSRLDFSSGASGWNENNMLRRSAMLAARGVDSNSQLPARVSFGWCLGGIRRQL